MTRSKRHSRGTITLNKRVGGNHVWVFRFLDETGRYKGVQFSTVADCRTRSQARIEADRLQLSERYILPAQAGKDGRKTIAQLIIRYRDQEMPSRFSTRHSYDSWLKLYISPRWGKHSVEDVKPEEVELWLKELNLAPKSKSHIKGMMTVLLNCAMKWQWIPIGRNPMELVTVRGASKRRSRPKILSPEQFTSFVDKINEEHVRVIAFTCMCLGLRLSEVLALKWMDIDWKNLVIYVRRGIVAGRLGDVKTEYSDAEAPLDPDLAEVLLTWQHQSMFQKAADWVFASPFQAGDRPYFPTAIQRKIHTAAKEAKLDHLFKGEPTKIMRHSYRSWLGTMDAPIGVIKDLMRHADVRTTMNVYGNGLQPAMREAHRKVVQMVKRRAT